MELKIGTILTISNDIISDTGKISFKKGDKVTVREIWKTEAKWSNIYNMWIPEVIHGVKLEEKYGIYFLSLFNETK